MSFVKKNIGTTLIELLMYMGLLMILLGIITNIFTSALDVQSESQSTSSVEQDGRFILSRLSYDIQRAQTIVIPASLGQQAATIQLTIDGILYSYSIDSSSNLQLVNSLGTNIINSYDSNVSNFSAQRIGNAGGVEDTLKISFTLTSRTQRIGSIETRQFQTTIAKRVQ